MQAPLLEQRGPTGPLLGPARGLRRGRRGSAAPPNAPGRHVPSAPRGWGGAALCLSRAPVRRAAHQEERSGARALCTAARGAASSPWAAVWPDARGAGGRAAGADPAPAARAGGEPCSAPAPVPRAGEMDSPSAPASPRHLDSPAARQAPLPAQPPPAQHEPARAAPPPPLPAQRPPAAQPDQADRAARVAGRAAGRAGAVARPPGQPARACRCGLK